MFTRGYRRKNMLADLREFLGRDRKRDPLKSIPKKYRPNVKLTKDDRKRG